MEPDAAVMAAETVLANDDIADADALQTVADALAEANPTWQWVGFYLLRGDTLVLGPFSGAPTEHTRIPVGTGLCGTAVEQGRNIVVGDVTMVDNYLACSAATRSEMIILVRDGGEIVGQLDIDSDNLDAFSPEDLDSLRTLADLAGPRCRRLAATDGD